MKEGVPLETARRFILGKQMLLQSSRGRFKREVIDVVRRLAGIQYDPLPVVAQAHYLTLWNRLENFKEEFLDGLLYEERKLIEFVLMRQAMHIVPVDELPYYYQAVQQVFRRGWVQKAIDRLSAKDAQEIMKRIKTQGNVSIKDFPYGKLRSLFYKGAIAISKREAGVFRMPYYSRLRTLHPELDLKSVDRETAQRWLVKKTVSAYGLASARHVAFWTGYKLRETLKILEQLEKENLVTKVEITGLHGYHWIIPEDLDKMERVSGEETVALLSPMDNLTRDRKWLKEMFDYSFSIEYFQKKGMRWQISILHNTDFLGFIDAKSDRPHQTLLIKELMTHRKVETNAWLKVSERIVDFAKFHRATMIKLGDKCPKWLTSLFIKLGYKCKDNLITID